MGGGIPFLTKKDLVHWEIPYKKDFEIIIDNEAMAINIDVSNNQNRISADVYWPDGNKISVAAWKADLAIYS